MIVKDDKALKDDLRKIDILKLAHHAISESSLQFLSTTKPDYVVISNKNVPKNSFPLINYMKETFNPKIYLTGNAKTENGEPSAAIKLNFTGEKEFSFSDTGDEIEKNGNDINWDGENHEFDKCKVNPSDQIFIVSGFGKRFLPCMAITGDYFFDIEGEFSKEANILDEIIIQLSTSTGNIIKSLCRPFNKITKYSKDNLQCTIDICMYHLEGIDLYLPTVAPNKEGYSFKKWENAFGLNPGESNKIKSVTCLPIIKNTFIPSSIETKGCSKNKTKFIIYGEWEDKDESKSIFFFDFSLVIEINERIAECYYVYVSPIHMECKVYGEKDILIKEQNFNGFLATYKMKKLDSSIKAEKCNVDSTESATYNSKSSYLLLMILLILI